MFGLTVFALWISNEIWRAIWLRWLELGRGRSWGRHFGEVAARPAPRSQIEGVFGAFATFGTRALDLARALTQLPKRATRIGLYGTMAVG